jgi:hypothetical protein
MLGALNLSQSTNMNRLVPCNHLLETDLYHILFRKKEKNLIYLFSRPKDNPQFMEYM